MAKSFVFSSESVGEGHPDKVADLISDSVLDACLAQDRTSRVACETMVKSNMVILAGEITTKANLNYEAIVRAAIREIGYVNIDDVFHADTVFINNYLTRQSPDISQGVDAVKVKGKKKAEQGAHHPQKDRIAGKSKDSSLRKSCIVLLVNADAPGLSHLSLSHLPSLLVSFAGNGV